MKPLKILIINPNSTASMTDKIAHCATLAASVDTKIIAMNPADSPPAIQGPADGDLALPHLFALFEAETARASYDAAIIACFDDTGLFELKRRAGIPVVGIGEAAFHVGMLTGLKFSVVTTLSVSVPVIEDNLAAYGFANRVGRVRASDIPVLDFEHNPDPSYRKLSDEIGRAVAEDGCDSIVLGCAGMTDLAERLSAEHEIPVIDGVKSAVCLHEMLAGMRSA